MPLFSYCVLVVLQLYPFLLWYQSSLEKLCSYEDALQCRTTEKNRHCVALWMSNEQWKKKCTSTMQWDQYFGEFYDK